MKIFRRSMCLTRDKNRNNKREIPRWNVQYMVISSKSTCYLNSYFPKINTSYQGTPCTTYKSPIYKREFHWLVGLLVTPLVTPITFNIWVLWTWNYCSRGLGSWGSWLQSPQTSSGTPRGSGPVWSATGPSSGAWGGARRLKFVSRWSWSLGSQWPGQ